MPGWGRWGVVDGEITPTFCRGALRHRARNRGEEQGSSPVADQNVE